MTTNSLRSNLVNCRHDSPGVSVRYCAVATRTPGTASSLSRMVLLDAGSLGLVTHPRGGEDAEAAKGWLGSLLAAGVPLRVPEIADYEVRLSLPSLDAALVAARGVEKHRDVVRVLIRHRQVRLAVAVEIRVGGTRGAIPGSEVPGLLESPLTIT